MVRIIIGTCHWISSINIIGFAPTLGFFNQIFTYKIIHSC